MYNEEYISYLNTLHNYNAQNPNSYGEKNVNNRFFKDVMVEIGLSKYIIDSIQNKEPHAIVLTGHAGDGKTSIMYQVLAEMGIEFNSDIEINDCTLPSGKICRCIKDFSEVSDEEKKTVLNDALQMSKNGNFVFMVANTGPLINTFGELFDSEEDKERAKIEIIDAMDSNTGKISDIKGYKICVINVAAVDNTYFASEFLEKLVQDNLWEGCLQCPKRNYCHIKTNRELIKSNFQRVSEFLNMHYIWLTEHGKRLTIRSMTEQLAYMITGGFDCNEVSAVEPYKYLFTNLFFGFVGTIANSKAHNIIAVKAAANCAYYIKRLRSDEYFVVNRDYNKVFGKTMAKIITDAEHKNVYISGWTEFLRRAYLFTNIETDSVILDNNCEDVFSKQFKKFLQLRNGESLPSRIDSNLVCDALSMIYVGTTNNESMIPLTLSRESGIAQNVQLITGTLFTKNIKIVLKPTKDALFNSDNKRYTLKLEVERKELQSEITLPLLNYFEELKNGIISTNVDPQLSHGIESLKAELSELSEEVDETFEMIILRNSGAKPVSLEISEDGKLREL